MKRTEINNDIMIAEIELLVEEACKSENNHFSYSIWPNHIKNVIKFAIMMADITGADREVVEIAAILHDYASVKDYSLYENHEIEGAKLARQILARYKYDANKIDLVAKCIENHRGSKPREKLSAEERCLADADAMAHFGAIHSLYYLAYAIHKLDVEEGKKWVAEKLERSWNKLSQQARDIVRPQYDAFRKISEDTTS